MKISYKDIIGYLKKKPKINELSEILFQLGHEHEIEKDMFDFEFTPNRGDCLSVFGIARDLNNFFETSLEHNIYEKKIDDLKIKFQNDDLKILNKFSENLDKIRTEIDKQNLNFYIQFIVNSLLLRVKAQILSIA